MEGYTQIPSGFMTSCDTFVALGSATADGSTLFAKNSDRDPNEPHEVIFVPRKTHSESTVKVTYITVPQVPETNAVLLCKPAWIWGAEMGTNEHGVTIGNEAIFAKVPVGREPGMISMDMLRLALERTNTAEKALRLIIDQLQTFGQSGNCSSGKPIFYHSSFLIADRKEAWVLETVDRHWAAKRITDGLASISNALSLHNTFDECSPGLREFAVEKGYCKSEQDFDFARCFSDFSFTVFGKGRERRQTTLKEMNKSLGHLTPQSMMTILRHHKHNAPRNQFLPSCGVFSVDICQHASYGPIRISQSTGSLVSRLGADGSCIHFITGTSAPCLSIFKPVWIIDGDKCSLESVSAKLRPPVRYDAKQPRSLWWQHEFFHRVMLLDYAKCATEYQRERDQLETEFVNRALQLTTNLLTNPDVLADFTHQCFSAAEKLLRTWTLKVVTNRRNPFGWPVRFRKTKYNVKWKELNQACGLIPGHLVISQCFEERPAIPKLATSAVAAVAMMMTLMWVVVSFS